MTRTAQIAGAGFAGLTVATELARRGWRVLVHERAAQPRAFGAGIFLWENGLQVLAALDAADEALADCHQAERWEERDTQGELLAARPLPLPGGLRMLTLTRQALLRALLGAARRAGVRTRPGSVAVAVTDRALVTADGRRWPGDLVIAADGIRSALRDALGVPTEHEVFPYGIYRFLTPLDLAPDTDAPWRHYVNYTHDALRRRVLYVPCGRRELYLLLGAPVGDVALRAPLDAELWRETFPTLRQVLAHVPATPRFDQYELLRLGRWSVGRVAIVGDAAHAMPPTIGQGAGTAMMNALNLARAVAAADDLPAALERWEADNRPSVEEAQRVSIAAMRALFPPDGARAATWSDGAMRVARDVPAS